MRNARNSEAAILLRRHERSIPYLVIFAFSNKGFLRRHIEKRKPQSPKIGSTEAPPDATNISLEVPVLPVQQQAHHRVPPPPS